MKKIITSAILLSLLALFISCAGSPAPTLKPADETTEEKVEVPPETPPVVPVEKPVTTIILDNAQKYTVVRGDTLSAIAVRHYGSGKGYFFPLIVMASANVVSDPDLIEPGMDLTVPDLKSNLDNPDTKKIIKEFFNKTATMYNNKTASWARDTARNLSNLADSL